MSARRPRSSRCTAAPLLALAVLAAPATVLAGTDPLQATASGAAASGGAISISDTDGNATDGVATQGNIFVDFTVPGTSFHAGQNLGTVTLSLASLSSGSGPVYPVTVTVSQLGGPALELLTAPVALTVFSPGAEPRAIPDAFDVPVRVTANEATTEGLAACVDGVPPPPLVATLAFSNPTSGRNKLGSGPNVKARVTLSCQEDADVVFCTVGHGCAGQPGGSEGGDIAFCNDPLAGWVTHNASLVLPMTVGGAHTLNTFPEAGSCASESYVLAAHQGQGSGSDFQTMCGQQGLIAYLPAGSTAGVLAPGRGSNREISGVADVMATDRQGSGSKGSGGGVLTGQTFAIKLSAALASGEGPFRPAEPGACGGGLVCGSDSYNAGASCATGGVADDSKCFDRVDFVPADLGGFHLPDPASGPVELCTQLSGEDRRLEESGSCGPASCTGGLCDARSANAGAVCTSDAECLPVSDDLCQKITFPDCVAGLSVSEIVHAAEEVLSGGTTSVCAGDPPTLTEALDQVHQAFDGCGKVVDCSLLD